MEEYVCTTLLGCSPMPVLAWAQGGNVMVDTTKRSTMNAQCICTDVVVAYESLATPKLRTYLLTLLEERAMIMHLDHMYEQRPRWAQGNVCVSDF